MKINAHAHAMPEWGGEKVPMIAVLNIQANPSVGKTRIQRLRRIIAEFSACLIIVGIG
jgi:hypothetical protein